MLGEGQGTAVFPGWMRWKISWIPKMDYRVHIRLSDLVMSLGSGQTTSVLFGKPRAVTPWGTSLLRPVGSQLVTAGYCPVPSHALVDSASYWRFEGTPKENTSK